MKKIIILFLLVSCSTSGAVLTAPSAPDAPAIKSADKLDPIDKKALIEFYKDYRVFLMKYNEWKKAWK